MVADVVTVAVPLIGGFGAALAGAWYGGRITLRAAREAAKRNDVRRRQDDIVALRAAARMVREQLGAVTAAIDGVLESNYWNRDVALDAGVWDANAGLLARLLDEDEWHAVTRAVAAARRRDTLTPTFGGPTHSKPEVHPVLRDYRAEVEAGTAVLNRYITIGALTTGPAVPK